MHYPESNEKAAELLRLIVPYLAGRELPSNPINYTVAYEYFRAGDKALTTLVEEREKEGPPPDEEFVRELFDRFFVQLSSGHCIAFGESLQATVEALIGKLAENAGGVNGISEELNQTLTSLDGPHNAQQIEEVVGQLIHLTERLTERTQLLHGDLEETRQETERLQGELEKAREQATKDSLTGLLNRYGFENELERLLNTHGNTNKRMVALLLDVDHFKKVNDNYGHIVGDQVLRKVGKTILESVSQTEHVAGRYGGEEFVVLLPTTPPAAARKIADDIRVKISELRLAKRGSGEKLPPIHISGGIALFKKGEAGHQWISRADDALYEAKSRGRNQIVSGDD